jgi:hypothetical protein
MSEPTMEDFLEAKRKDKWIKEENISALNVNIFELTTPEKPDLKKQKEILSLIKDTKSYNKKMAGYKKTIKSLYNKRLKATDGTDLAEVKRLNVEINKLESQISFKKRKQEGVVPLEYLKSELSKAKGESQRIYFHTPAGRFSAKSTTLEKQKNPAKYILNRARKKFENTINKSYEQLMFLDEVAKERLGNQIKGLESIRDSIDLNLDAVAKNISVKEIDPSAYEIFYSYSFDHTEVDLLIVGGGKKKKSSNKDKETKGRETNKPIENDPENINF